MSVRSNCHALADRGSCSPFVHLFLLPWDCSLLHSGQRGFYVLTWKECSRHLDSDVESTLVSACTAAASRGDLTAQGTLGTTSVIQQVPTSIPPTSEGGGGRYQPPPAGSEHFCSRATPARTSSGETGAARHLGSTRSTRSPGREGPLPAGSLLKV